MTQRVSADRTTGTSDVALETHDEGHNEGLEEVLSGCKQSEESPGDGTMFSIKAGTCSDVGTY